MQSQDVRLQSFAAVIKPKSKVKPAWPLSPSTHPHLTPQRLAKAGFYHTPGKDPDSLDIVTCFLCQLILGGWDETDDPDVEHAKRGGCAWAKFVCETQDKDRIVFNNEEELPTSSQSLASRVATYGKWWPHKAKAGWLPTVSNLASAGFIYAPSSGSNDTVMCPLCNYAVEGWEATDDAWEVHRSKVPQCPFFNSTLAVAAPVKKSRATKSMASSSAASRRTKRTPAPSEAEQEQEEAPEMVQEAPEASVASTSRSNRRATKASVASSEPARTKRSAKSRAIQSEAEVEVVEEEEDVEPVAVKAKVKPKPKAKAAPRAKAAPKAKKGKGKEKAVEPDEATEEDAGETQETKPSPAEAETEAETGQETEPEPETDAEGRLTESDIDASVPDPPSRPSSARSKQAEIIDLPTPKASQRLASPPPPPVPSKDTPKARPIRPLSTATKARASPRAALPRPVLDASLQQGAVAARHAFEKALTPKADAVGAQDLDAPLTKEQEEMTVEELVRHEMQVQYEELEREGEEAIAKWKARTTMERARIETI